jgi:RNA polymerase sigma-70 factor (ECF subfamily)
VTEPAAPGQVLDTDRFEQLVRDAAPPLLRFARSIVRDEATAEDLVQETFLRAWRSRDRYRGDAAPVTWLRRILHNAAIDRFRRAEREQLVDAVELQWRDDTYTVDSDLVADRASDRDALHDALIHLPFTYRAALVLHDVEGWTAADVADALGIGVPLAKQRIRRGRMALVSHLSRADDRRAALEGVRLRCWDARALVSDYLDDELPDDQRRALESHLGSCPTCPPLYTALVGTRAALGELRDADAVVPPDLVSRIQTRLGARPG